MIVLKYTYDKSITSTFSFSFNNGFTPTTTEETSGNLVTVTVESDTPFTTIGIPAASEPGLVAVHYMDLSNVSKIEFLFERCVNLTDVTFNNSTTNLTNIANVFYFYADNPHKNPINISFVNCNLSAIPDNLAYNFINAEYKNIPSLTFDNCVLGNGKTMGKIIGACKKETKLIFKNCTTAPSTSFERMFYATGRTEVDLSGIDFTNVTSTYLMFSNSQIRKLTLPKGDFYNLTDISMMFEGAYYIEEVDISDFHIMNPVNITNMFVNCRSLKKVNLSGININKSISFNELCGGTSVCEWFDISNLKAIPSSTTNFWKSQAVVENVGMLYCPANVINTIAPLLVGSGRTCNIYYHDAKLEDLKVDSRFNYIYCEEYHGDTVSTPDDLELHDLYYSYNNGHTMDTLDLTTGVCTKNISKFSDSTKLTVMDGSTDIGYFRILLRWDNLPNIVRRGNGTGIICNIMPVVYAEQGANGTQGVFAHGMGNFFVFYIYCNKTGVTTGAEAIQWMVDNGWEILYEQTSETVQLDINPLKSYRNGSITTSSQQLAPTLTTTLPISNKFTTTNLTSGSTYNVYFDGTATKLDAGGTIITNPVSPCEVECGGTTLTIEGIDIQNVRVLETTVKNEVGSVCGTTDVELSRVITSDLEVITNGIEFSSASTGNGNINTVDNKLGTINTKGGHAWGVGNFTSNKTYPKGFSLLHIEFDVDMPSNNLMAIINFNNNVGNTYYNFRDLTLDNDTATIAQGQTSGVGTKYSSIVTKGHFSRLIYCFSSQGTIQLGINTGSSAMLTLSGNNAEGSTSGYTACANNGITISNFKIKVIENYPNVTTPSQITSSLRTDSGLTVIWQEMNMSIGQSISKLEQPIKLRSLGTTYDSYNLVTGELTKRIGVSETDGSYSVLSSPVVSQVMKVETLTNLFSADFSLLVTNNYTKLNEDIITHKVETNSYNHLFFNYSKLKPNTVYTVILNVIENNLIFTTSSDEYVISSYVVNNYHLNEINNKVVGYKIGETGIKTFVFITPDSTTLSSLTRNPFLITPYGKLTNQQTIKFKIGIVEGDYSYTNMPYFIDTETLIIPVYPHNTPQLYTNGQVKVYSDSEVYPTTILNGQSTNNYEVNELNKSNNYTIRYDGTCESINLNGKSNEQGTNRIVKTSTNGSGNLTFVNDSGDIDNVLLVQNDVREQEINHFTGLQTVEISQMLIQNQKNMWSQDFIMDTTLTPNYQRISKDYIKVVPNETLYCSIGQTRMDYCDIIQYNENKERVTSTRIFGWPTSGMYQDENNIYKNKVQLSENTHYIRICIHQAFLTTASVSRGDFLPPSTLAHNQYQGQYINLPQPVQLNSLPNGTCDTYNPITGEYVQRVGCTMLTDGEGFYVHNTYNVNEINTLGFRGGNLPITGYHGSTSIFSVLPIGTTIDEPCINYQWHTIILRLARKDLPTHDIDGLSQYLQANPLKLFYPLDTPITTQLTPINIPTFEGGTLQLVTTDGKVFPMIEYSMPTLNRYDTSSWETGAVYTQRNMTEAYFNESTTPMTPTETMTLTTDHISSGSIILNDNGNGLIVLKGNYTGRDIPYFTGMRSVEAIEIETTASSDQPLFGKGGRK